MDKIFTLEKRQFNFKVDHIKLICEETTRDSMLRKYALDKFVSRCRFSELSVKDKRASLEPFPKDFLIDWIDALHDIPYKPRLLSKEDYHVPVAKMSNDLAEETGNIAIWSSKDKSSEGEWWLDDRFLESGSGFG
jgi:hypothetical protein